jgi:hypothetical protein
LRFNALVVLPARDREALEQAVGRGSELLKQGKLDQAQRAFRAALEIDPESSRVLALLGLAHFRANEFADARGVYEQLVERAPTDASHRLNLGLVYLKLNDADRAISALEASRALDPSQGRAVSYLGLAYARGGRYAEAYRAFLIAGQNDLAIEIESNLTPGERDRIHGQLGRTPQGPVPAGAQPAFGAQGGATAPRTAAATVPRTPTPTGIPRTPPAGVPRSPTPPGVRRTPPPDSLPPDAGSRTTTPISMAADAASRTTTPAGATGTGSRTPTPVGVPRTKPPSAPPGKRRPSQELPAAAPAESSGGVATVHDVQGKIHIDAAAATGAVPFAAPQGSTSPHDSARVSDSMQFVMPRGEPAAPQQSLDGASMISRAVASATPSQTIGLRTRAGGSPPRPLSELATDELIRPDEGEDAFEISASGALIIRVAERMMTRLDGVSITGGDLGYELATRRSRGHNTDEAFDYGGSQLHAVSGRGYLIAIPGDHTFSAVNLDDDILYLREDLVFAFQAQLRWENGNVPGLRGRLPVVQFRGNGALAMRLPRPLVRVKLPAQGTLFIDADRLAGWIGRVIPRAVVPPPGGPLGAMCVECTGEGVVLIEAAAREVTDVPRVTAKWPRVTVEPFPVGTLLIPAAGSSSPTTTPPASSGGDAPAERLVDVEDTARTAAGETTATDATDDRDHLGDLDV